MVDLLTILTIISVCIVAAALLLSLLATVDAKHPAYPPRPLLLESTVA